MSELLEKIRSRGYWRVVIRPHTFVDKLITDRSELLHILEKTYVEVYSWEFPYLGSGAPPQCGKDWIGHECDWGRHLELWRFFQSGQLVVLKGMREDWWDQSELWPPPDDWKHGQFIEMADIVHQFTAIFELAARLAFTKASTGQTHLEINVRGLKGRGLNISDKLMDSSYFGPFKASLDEFTCKVDVSHIELIADTKDLALNYSVALFQHFGWEAYMDLLRDIQAYPRRYAV